MSTVAHVRRLTDAAVAPEELKARAREIAVDVRARADETARARDLAPEPIAALHAATLLRMFQPARWGGLEADPRIFYDVQNILSEACASTGWVFGVLNIQSFVVALFGEQAQTDVWGADDTALACSSFAPTGMAEPVEGGFRLSGQWTFSSGSTFAQWAVVGAKLGGSAPGAAISALRLYLVPRADFRVLDTWNTIGLRGTGSNDLVIENAFVPAHRVLPLDPGVANVKEQDRPGPALYRLPWMYMLSSTISNFAIGVVRAALSAFLEINASRVASLTGKVAKDDPVVHQLTAKTIGAIDTADAMFKRHIATLTEHVATDQPIALANALTMRVQMCSCVRGLAAIVDEMALLLGGAAIREESPFTRCWLDLMAARVHFGNDPSGALGMLGKMMLDEAVAAAG